jgi:hypothetical protein
MGQLKANVAAFTVCGVSGILAFLKSFQVIPFPWVVVAIPLLMIPALAFLTPHEQPTPPNYSQAELGEIQYHLHCDRGELE